jgi:hypothetical protein
VLIVKVLLAHVLVLVAILVGFLGGMQENAKTWLWVLIAVGAVIVFISAGLRRAPGGWHRRGAPARGTE